MRIGPRALCLPPRCQLPAIGFWERELAMLRRFRARILAQSDLGADDGRCQAYGDSRRMRCDICRINELVTSGTDGYRGRRVAPDSRQHLLAQAMCRAKLI